MVVMVLFLHHCPPCGNAYSRADERDWNVPYVCERCWSRRRIAGACKGDSG
jgi:predicted RNA-binding Zn-ribbon protein involved in translation (DUF1610 family)